MNDKTYYCIGVMSGTSLDGIDICYARFDYNRSYRFKILTATTYKYSDSWKLKLRNAYTRDENYLKNLDLEYGNYIGQLVNQHLGDSVSEILVVLPRTQRHKGEHGQGVCRDVGVGRPRGLQQHPVDQQQGHRHDAPGDAEQGQDAAQGLTPKRVPGLH